MALEEGPCFMLHQGGGGVVVDVVEWVVRTYF